VLTGADLSLCGEFPAKDIKDCVREPARELVEDFWGVAGYSGIM
jgi:hypothetical protein